MISRLNQPVLLPVEQNKQQFHHNVSQLIEEVDKLVVLASTSSSTDSLQRTFVSCRLAYKRIEPMAEYFFSATTRLVNGPPLPEIEVEETKQFQPEGLQVIEEYLYPTFDKTQRSALVDEVRRLSHELKRYHTLWEATELTDAHVFDALRLAIFRVLSLGISGFDTPLCQNAMPEAAEVLTSICSYLMPYETTEPESAALVKLLREAETYLKKNAAFDTFDRAFFIINYANPISAGLLTYQKRLGIQVFDEKRPLRSDAETLFAANVFDPDAYASTVDARMNKAKIELGKRLFNDPILSSNGARSCAGCHQADKAFTDGMPRNVTLNGQKSIGRNTPTLLNVALQAGHFYDLRSASLEDQSFDVIHNTDEMHGSLANAAKKIQQNDDYVALVKKAFPLYEGTVEPIHLQNALAAYERTLVSLDSRFDKYMRGKKTALSAEEIHGFNLFMGKAKCGICHFVPLFNGTVPPNYRDTESEVIGTPATSVGQRIDPDMGRYVHTKLDVLKYAFKTPTIRNIAYTAPYMHNGVYATLEQVVDFYDKGGGNGLGFGLDNQTLPEDKLNLSAVEKKALVAFMKAL
ncbi:cytochrome c peroxidase [Spirosoma daeguense]